MGLTRMLEEEAVTCCFAELESLLSSRVCLLVGLHLRFTCLQDLVPDGQETGAVGALGQI